MNAYQWYNMLLKPEWAPPAWLFAPVWTVLYIFIAISFGAVFYYAYKKEIPNWCIIPFVLNLLFNIAFTPLQFGLKNNFLAGIDILLVLGTLVWGILAIICYKRWIAYSNIPYMVWVMFATTLQISIIFLN